MKGEETHLRSLRGKHGEAGRQQGPISQRQRINMLELEGEEAVPRPRVRVGRTG